MLDVQDAELKLEEQVNGYVALDIGELNKKLHIADGSELDLIKQASIKLGHARLFDRVYQALGEKAGQYILSPKEEVMETLRHAIGCRGFSIDDRGTSVGSLYQRLYGADFTKVPIKIHTDKGELMIPYSELKENHREMVNEQILAHRGYTPIQPSVP